MIYSEGLSAQHLAHATSPNLYTWQQRGELVLPKRPWLQARFARLRHLAMSPPSRSSHVADLPHLATSLPMW